MTTYIYNLNTIFVVILQCICDCCHDLKAVLCLLFTVVTAGKKKKSEIRNYLTIQFLKRLHEL